MFNQTTQLFFELIQITVGAKDNFQRMPISYEWDQLYHHAVKQSLAGVLLDGIKKVKATQKELDRNLLLGWIGIQQMAISRNRLQNERTIELCELLEKAGFKCCILKGQGTSLYYEYPEHRQCGDIDVWVTKEGGCKTDDVRREIIQYAKSKGYSIGHVDIKHSDISFFEDVPVEVHFTPSWMYNPITNKRLQRFLSNQSRRQFANMDEPAGYTHTTVDFDLVFSLVHIYRHVFSEGIGLRQLMDYYYILLRSSMEQRKEAFRIVCSLKMTSFAGGIMWILKECFGMREDYLLCHTNEQHGQYILSEVLMAGNFGRYDNRLHRVDHNKKVKRGIVQLKRNLRFINYYPSEVLWSPIWKVWHYVWRKRKGYL